MARGREMSRSFGHSRLTPRKRWQFQDCHREAKGGASHTRPAQHFATSGHGDGEELGKMADPAIIRLAGWNPAGIGAATAAAVRPLVR